MHSNGVPHAPGILWMAMADDGPSKPAIPVFSSKNSLGCEHGLLLEGGSHFRLNLWQNSYSI